MSPETAVLERLDYLEAALPVPEFVGVAYVATKLGVSPSYLRARWWLLPLHGVTEVPGRLLWSLKTVRAWMTVSPADRDAQWSGFPPALKKTFDLKRKAAL
jgi:hypothetical protein